MFKIFYKSANTSIHLYNSLLSDPLFYSLRFKFEIFTSINIFFSHNFTFWIFSWMVLQRMVTAIILDTTSTPAHFFTVSLHTLPPLHLPVSLFATSVQIYEFWCNFLSVDIYMKILSCMHLHKKRLTSFWGFVCQLFFDGF